MKRILIVGISDIVGGIETLFNELFGKKIFCFDVTFLCFDKPCAFAENYISQGYKIDIIPSRKSNPFKFSHRVKEYLQTHAYFDYVWINVSSASIWQFQVYTKKYTKAKVITHSHGTKFEKTGSILLHIGNLILHHLNLRRVLSNTDLFFCCSKAAGIALYGKEKMGELTVVNNGINCDKYGYRDKFRNEIRKEFLVKEEEVLIGLVGRLSPQKNPVKAVEIFNAVYEKNPQAKLLIVGTGDLLVEVQQKIADLNISKQVIIAGMRSDVYKIYSALDVLIMPSLFEGLPLTAIEAQCSGLNCLFSDKITQEVAISDLANFIALNSDNAVWADAIIDIKQKKPRYDYCQLVKNQGYDSIEVRKRIVNLLNADK